MVGETNKLLRSKLPKLLESMSLYLANKDTESILFKPIKVGIQEAYRDFRRIIDQHYRPSSSSKGGTNSSAVIDATSSTGNEGDDDADEDVRIIACPEAEELNLLLTSVIAGANNEKKSSSPLAEISAVAETNTEPTVGEVLPVTSS